MAEPDSIHVTQVVSSPNHDERQSEIDMLVLHYTGMRDAQAAKQRLCDPAAKVSSHYIVDEDGTIIQIVAEHRRAWHAGVSCWDGVTDINSCSIGIEIVNGGHDFGLPDFPAKQIEAVANLCRDIQTRWTIADARVLAHSDIAPARKADPGEKFPWDALRQSGVGLWVPADTGSSDEAVCVGSRGDLVLLLKASLAEYGYCIDQTDIFDDAMRDVVIAFQRHFHQHRVDGVADRSVLSTLENLLQAKRRAKS